MSKTQKPSNIRDAVMRDISAGTVTMRPHTYFTMLSVLVAAVVVTASLVSAYLVSMLYFWVRILTAGTPAYGARSRLSEAVATFPWWLALCAVGLSVAAVVLVRRHGRLYRHRARTLAALLVLVSLLIGMVFASMNIGQHSGTMRQDSLQPGQHAGQGRHLRD